MTVVPFRPFIVLLLLAAALASGVEPEVRKPRQRMKARVGAPPSVLEHIPDSVDPVWQLLQRADRRCGAFLIGDRSRVESGDLTADDFVPVYPPDVLASLGMATVYKPDTAGWYVIAGRRVHVRTTDPERQYATLSYESMARVAWGVGIASDTLPAARVFYDSGLSPPGALGELLIRAIGAAPETGVWLVAGHARFASLRGQALRRPPIDGRSLERPDSYGEGTEMLFGHVSERAQSALMVAIVTDSRVASGVVDEVSRRVFAGMPEERVSVYRVRIHYAAFRSPAPLIDAGAPFQAMWQDPAPGEDLPRVRVVRQGFPDSTVRKAHLSVWAVDSVGPFDLYPEPEFVDVTDLRRDMLTEQKWATDATFVGEPIYEKPRLVLRKPVAEAIVRIDERLRERGLRLKLYDGYRPLSVTQRLWKLRPDRRYLAVPNIGSRHNRGAAVDLTLTDLEGRELEMPSAYLTFDERSHRDRKDMTERARENMGRLTRAMASEGFTGINEEWWHYDAPGWERYRVADVPLWPRPGQEVTTASLQADFESSLPPAESTTGTLRADGTERTTVALPTVDVRPTTGPALVSAPLAPGTDRPITGLLPPPWWRRYRLGLPVVSFLLGVALTMLVVFISRRSS